MKVSLSSRAKRDLSAIRKWTEERSPSGADSVEMAILSKIKRLESFPRSAKRTDEAGVRMLSIVRYPYVVLYRVFDDEVIILHIRHTSRDSDDAGSL